MFIVTYFIAYAVKTLWCQLPVDGEIIATKHVAATYKIVRINYRIVHLLVLHELFLLHNNVGRVAQSV